MDYNREVRRATHDTMSNLVTAVGFELLCVLSLFFFFSFGHAVWNSIKLKENAKRVLYFLWVLSLKIQ